MRRACAGPYRQEAGSGTRAPSLRCRGGCSLLRPRTRLKPQPAEPCVHRRSGWIQPRRDPRTSLLVLSSAGHPFPGSGDTVAGPITSFGVIYTSLSARSGRHRLQTCKRVRRSLFCCGRSRCAEMLLVRPRRLTRVMKDRNRRGYSVTPSCHVASL